MARSTADISTRLIKRLQNDTQIVDADPGSIARAFAEILAEEFGQFYTELDLNTTMSYVSTASGRFLELIGALLNCTRLTGETDTNYRSRIVNQVYVLAGGNLTSIRLKVLAITGIKDVVTREFTKGTGSFSLYIITDSATPSQTLLNEAQDVVNRAKSLGILGEVKFPALLPVSLKVRLIFNDRITDPEKASIRQSSKQAMKTYVDNLGMGGSFDLNEMLRTSLTTTKVLNAEVISMTVSNVPQFAKNFVANWDERIVIDVLDVI